MCGAMIVAEAAGKYLQYPLPGGNPGTPAPFPWITAITPWELPGEVPAPLGHRVSFTRTETDAPVLRSSAMGLQSSPMTAQSPIMKTLFLALLLLATPQLQAKAPLPTALGTYIAAPDTSTKWELARKVSVGESDVWQLTLTSQTWQGITWTHDLLVIRPKSAPPTDQMLLINSGGSFDAARPKDLLLGATLAQGINAPVAVLLGIPKQPLFGGKKERRSHRRDLRPLSGNR